MVCGRYLAVLTLGFLMLDGSFEDELTSDGAIEQIQNFILECHPNDVVRSEDAVTNDQGIKWKFIRPFLRLTYSRHLPVKRLGAFALATLSRRRALLNRFDLLVANFDLLCLQRGMLKRWLKRECLVGLYVSPGVGTHHYGSSPQLRCKPSARNMPYLSS